ncbi:putative ATP-binding protein involved in virulence [Microvirga lupini]|uniref:Putative ATP-binding protein involved in virulence n=1 Tax=Microvirga lupini TaxID=420324 RepID=A0A7W4VJ91_9HYPH|nr:AAA family ATPase [Microvirga lupini]MBB3017612.1 putative ATP-binding protein involved in virulence [Microvirga lupini]
MKIAKLSISNILGIKQLEFEAGTFNEISGRNGEGKTSVLEAIKTALQGGHDATLLRKGEEKGEVVLVLDDSTEIRKRVTQSSSPLSVTRDGEKVKKPTDALRELIDSISVNPVEFLTARKQDRVKVLLESMPIVVDAKKLEQIANAPVMVDTNVHGLQVIEAVRKQVYDDRTGTNRAIKEKDATINQLRLAMPDAPGGVEGSEDELRSQVDAATVEKDKELERIRNKLDGIKTENQTKVDAIRSETQRQIDELKAKALAEVEAIQTEERRIEGLAGQQREKAIQKHTDTVAPLNQAIASISANRSAHAKREQAEATIKQMETELEELTQDAAAQSQAITDIDKYKSDLLASLPIPGLEVVDGEVFRDAVPFDRLNTAQQVDIAVEIAKLRAGSLGVICCDGLELLDKGAFEAFRDRALESGLQLFITRVSDEEFAVNTATSED